MTVSFTVAIPTHDRRDTVLLALHSVLFQTRSPDQIIVLCDGCHDGTQAAVAALGEPRIEVLDLPKEPGYGYAHRNRALQLARGDVILWLGDDDLIAPDHLERIADRFGDNLDLVQTYAARVDPDDALTWMGGDWSVPGYRAILLEHANTTPMGAVAVRVSAARAVGGWDPARERAGDWDLWKRVVGRDGTRTASTDTATLLHFRATGRAQEWGERVAQNTAWLQRLRDPQALAALRARLAALRSEREAYLEREVVAVHASRESVMNEYELLLAEYEKLRVAYEALIRA